MIKGPLILLVAIRMVTRFVFQPYGCAKPSIQQSLTIQSTGGATGAGMEKNNLLSERQTRTNLTRVISHFGERMNDIQTQACHHLCKQVCLT